MRRDQIFWWHELFRASFRNRAERLTTSKLHVVQHLQICATHLSIHDGHNAAAAIAFDGELVFAVPEEQLTGIKNFVAIRRRQFASEIEQVAFAKFSSRPIGSLAIDLFLEFFRDNSLRIRS